MLALHNVSYRYPGDETPTVQDLSFAVRRGEFVSLIGQSGCGKSTVFRLINGLLTPQAGQILVGSRPITGQKRYCGYMPQRDLLFVWRTVGQNLALPLEVGENPLPKAEREARVRAMLGEMGLAGCEHKYPAALSGGMRQRAAFGRTLLTDCELLLLDEPFSALDFLTRVSMQAWLLQQCRRHQKTVLFITHDVEEALFLSDRVLAVTQTPIAALTEIAVPLPAERTREMLLHPEIAALQSQLLRLLQGG